MNTKVNLVLAISILFMTYVTGKRVINEIQINRNAGNNIMDVSDFSVYYDLKTNETIKKMMPRPWYRPGWPLRLPFSGGPCTCEGPQCMCCSGMRIPAFNFDRQVCTVLTYNVTDFMLNMNVTLNGKEIYKNSFSATNAPPFCAPIPVPYLPPGLVDFCVRLFDISFVEQKLHVCMDMDTRIDKAPILVLHFECMDMGLGGVSLSKPGNGGSQLTSANTTESNITDEPQQVNSDVFDPVYETPNNGQTNVANVTNSVRVEQLNSDVYDPVYEDS